MEDIEENMKDGNVSPSSSPPTPPSPLPISTGPGNQRYLFSPSPSLSPPFSPPPSSHTSAKNLLPFWTEKLPTTAQAPSAFSLDRKVPDDQVDDKTTTCLIELIDWLFQRCCSCFSWSRHVFAQRQKQD